MLHYQSLSHTHAHTDVLQDVQTEKKQPSGKQILFNYTIGTYEQPPPPPQTHVHKP